MKTEEKRIPHFWIQQHALHQCDNKVQQCQNSQHRKDREILALTLLLHLHNNLLLLRCIHTYLNKRIKQNKLKFSGQKFLSSERQMIRLHHKTKGEVTKKNTSNEQLRPKSNSQLPKKKKSKLFQEKTKEKENPISCNSSKKKKKKDQQTEYNQKKRT